MLDRETWFFFSYFSDIVLIKIKNSFKYWKDLVIVGFEFWKDKSICWKKKNDLMRLFSRELRYRFLNKKLSLLGIF